MFARTRADIAVSQGTRPGGPSTLSALTNYPGFWAVWGHRVTHRLHQRDSSGSRAHQPVGPASYRHRDPSRRDDRRALLHRPRHGRGHRRDDRSSATTSPSTRASRSAVPARRAASGTRRSRTASSSASARRCSATSRSATAARSAAARSSSTTCPPNCTVVGVPGRVVVREGQRVETIDLHHEDLPDPVVEMFRCLQRRIDRLEDVALAARRGASAERDRTTAACRRVEGWTETCDDGRTSRDGRCASTTR